ASTNSYHSYGLEEALSGMSRAGLTLVELTSVPGWTEHVPRDATPDEIRDVKQRLAYHGLTPVSLSGHSDLVSDEGVVEFRKALRLCRELGIDKVTTSTGGHDASSAGSLDEQRKAFLQRIRPLADEADAEGITICLETHGGLLATGQMAAELIRQIDRPNVGINYDPGNVIFYGATRPEIDLPGAVDKVVHMHVKDQKGGPGVWNFPQVGTGEVDFRELFRILDEAGFDGPCSIELEFQGEPWPALAAVDEAMANSVKYLRRYVPAD
ncbi:MAG TPA: sugar phosphate isomerase/epimerase family protein, partial [Thermomicrobiales bacterium]|nr:sugar phosphate isomerase/epimerase family protein [Thermomicrobiales bacterium]